jgi:hypothetical protein
MDKTLTIPARSSSGDKVYYVTFTFQGNRMSVKCDCPAGRFGKFCKHKFGLLKGNDYWLHDDADDADLAAFHEISAWVQKSDYMPYIFKNSKLQRALDEAEANMKDFRSELADVMKSGLPRMA